jgi:hypothetical protein
VKRARSGTARCYRVLVLAYPRATRRALGAEMVRLVDDRRRLDGEPRRRLWPALLADTLRAAPAQRWEVLVSTRRAQLFAGLVTLGVVAFLSDGLVTALPVLLAVAVAIGVVTRQGRPLAPPAHAGAWRPWALAAAACLLVALGTLAAAGGAELHPAAWVVFFVSVVGGIFCGCTGVLLALRRSAPRHA